MLGKDLVQGLLTSSGITINGNASYDMHVRNPSVYWRIAILGSLGLGETYMRGDWDCDALDVYFDRLLRHGADLKIGRSVEVVQTARDWILNRQTVRRAFQVGRHYNLSNNLYQLMLGSTMQYSCGYWHDAANLDDAQIAKMDLVCRKAGLQNRRGQKVLEIGCGWGHFAAYASETYGARVLGITISREQWEYAKNKFSDLSDVEFYLDDYRVIDKQLNDRFDVVVSVAMLEAVGLRNLQAFMRIVSTLLKPEGNFVLHTILGSGVADPWISRHIFPNGILPSVSSIFSATEGLFKPLDFHRFGQDYDKTLMEWHKRFQDHWPVIHTMPGPDGRAFDETFRRMWRYYLLMSAGLFRSGTIDVGQFVFGHVRTPYNFETQR